MIRVIVTVALGAAAAALSLTSALAYDGASPTRASGTSTRSTFRLAATAIGASDRLGSRAIMHTGDRYVLSDVGGGCYDVKLVDEDGDVCVINKVRINDDMRMGSYRPQPV